MTKQKKLGVFGLCAESNVSDGEKTSVKPRRSMKRNEIYQKMVHEGRVHSECINAYNPYHSCQAYCYERMGKPIPDIHAQEQGRKADRHRGSGTTSAAYNLGSEISPKTIAVKNETIQVIDSEPEPTNEAEEIKLPYAGIPHCSSMNTDSIHSTRIPSKEGDDMSDAVNRTFVGSMNSIISEITVASDEDDDDDGSSRVSVGNHHVRRSNAHAMHAILNNHGDVAAKCSLRSARMRSHYLDSVCYVVRELQSVLFLQLTRTKVSELTAVVEDAEAAGVEVGWLKGKLGEITEAMALMSRHSAIKAAKTRCEQSVEMARKELAFLEEDVAEREAAVQGSRHRVEQVRKQLRDLEDEAVRLNESYSDIRSKVQGINIRSLSEDLIF